MSSHYLGDAESLKDLESRMMSPDREMYRSFGHLRVEAAFIGRVYIIYKPTGLTSQNTHRTPEIISQVLVKDFVCDAKRGCTIEVEDMMTGETQWIGHIPQRLFGYPVFVCVPPFLRLRWDGRPVDGQVRRSLAFGILIKTRTRSDYYSAGATMVETPKGFRALYPDVTLPLRYV